MRLSIGAEMTGIIITKPTIVIAKPMITTTLGPISSMIHAKMSEMALKGHKIQGACFLFYSLILSTVRGILKLVVFPRNRIFRFAYIDIE